MTTLSAGAAAGLLVALMVMSTADSRGAELTTGARPDAGLDLATTTRTVYQLQSVRGIGRVIGESAYAARA